MLRIHRASFATVVVRVRVNAGHARGRIGHPLRLRDGSSAAHRRASGERTPLTWHTGDRRTRRIWPPTAGPRGQRSPQRRATSVTKRPRRAPARVYDAHSPFTPPHQRHAPPRRSPEPRKPLRSRGALPLAVENTLGSALDSALVSALGSSTARFRPMPI